MAIMDVETAKSTFIKALQDNRWPFPIPFGYKEGPSEIKIVTQKNGSKIRNRKIALRTIVIDEEKRHALLDIFSSYASGNYSFGSLRKYINEKYGTNFAESHLELLLKNKFYIGLMDYDGIIYTHNYGNLINNELWERTQYIKVKRSSNRFREVNIYNYAYKSIMKCAECGLSITAESPKGYIYYKCTQSKFNHKAPYLREEVITDYFHQKIEEWKGVPLLTFYEKLTDEQKEAYDIFDKNFKKWFQLSFDLDKRNIINLLFKDIKIHQDRTITCEWNTPFNGENSQDFYFENLIAIVDRHSNDRKLYKKPNDSELNRDNYSDSTNDFYKLIIINCKKGASIDDLLEITNLSITELNNFIFDLQIEGKIEQNESGKWKAR